MFVECVVVCEVHVAVEFEEGVMECFYCDAVRCGDEFETLVEHGNLVMGNGMVGVVDYIVVVRLDFVVVKEFATERVSFVCEASVASVVGTYI